LAFHGRTMDLPFSTTLLLAVVFGGNGGAVTCISTCNEGFATFCFGGDR
jgi:hypothetical protein